MAEKRHYERVRFVERAHVNCGDTIYPCMIVDLSLKGSLLELDQQSIPPLDTDQLCEISLHLAGNTIVLRFEAVATHSHLNTIGFQFKSMDTESMTHLRRLLELNTGDPEEIDREIHYMMEQLVC